MLEIDSAAAAQIVDSSSHALVQELREKHKTTRLAPLGLLVGVVFTALGFAAPQPGFGVPVFLLSVGLYVLLHVSDVRRKTTVIFYDLADDSAGLFRGLHDAFTYLGKAQKFWHIPAEGTVRDAKYHAGANTLVTRTAISVGFTNPPFVKTNIPTPSLRVGAQTLYFFPDRILIFDAKEIGGLGYESLRMDISTTNFIEQDGVPRDARTVGQTWRYVNKKGGPDRRFANNPQIPIAEYEAVRLSSRFGLNEALQVSRIGSFAKIVEAVGQIESYLRGNTGEAQPVAQSPVVSEDVVEVSQSKPGKSGADWFLIFATGIAGLCIALLMFAHSPPEAPRPEASAPISTPRPMANSEKAVPSVPSVPPVAQLPTPRPAVSAPVASPRVVRTDLEPGVALRFSEKTPLPVTVILSQTLILKSREHGVVGLGKGKQITVTARLDQQLTVVANDQSFRVDAGELAGAIVLPPTEASVP